MDNDKRNKYINDFKKTNYKRVSLELKKSDYEKLQAAAAAAGEPVNAFIKKAITEKLERTN